MTMPSTAAASWFVTAEAPGVPGRLRGAYGDLLLADRPAEVPTDLPVPPEPFDGGHIVRAHRVQEKAGGAQGGRPPGAGDDMGGRSAWATTYRALTGGHAQVPPSRCERAA